MKINVIKTPGSFAPWGEIAVTEFQKFKKDEVYEMEIKRTRNPRFHRKVFAFFNFCFAHWADEYEMLPEFVSFDMFRRNMLVLAGYKDVYYTIGGEFRVEAKSISFGSMSEDDFKDCYSALINTAMKSIFKTTDENTFNQLVGFF